MDKNYFCTLFDINYLAKGVAMLRSLERFCPKSHVFVLCMDDQTKPILESLNFSHVTYLTLDEVEDQDLLEVKPGRNRAEYCWTLSPCLPWYILKKNPHVEFITYLDADLYFYSDIQPILDEIGDASIAIIEHRFVPELKHLENRGRFCVEWVSFRRDAEGLACLQRWREQCIEWCFYRLEKNRMGDQKYLDAWPNSYKNLHIIKHPGAGVAPWNYAAYEINGVDGVINIDENPLIFYHFHQFQILSFGRFDRLSKYYTRIKSAPNSIYSVYESATSSIMKEIRFKRPKFNAGIKSYFRVKAQRLVQFLAPEFLKHALKNIFKAV
jgi:hypothetical protein